VSIKKGRRGARACTRRARAARWLRAVLFRVAAWFARTCVAVRAWTARRYRGLALGRRIPVEILVADGRRRRRLKREVRTGLRQLRRVLGSSFPAHVTIVVQQAVCPAAAERLLAGCAHVGTRPDGTRFAHVRLALQVDGHELTVDEVLAALAEQCIGLATQSAGMTTVLIPVDLNPAAARRTPLAEAAHTAPARSSETVRVERLDPLLGSNSTNGSNGWTRPTGERAA